MKLEEEVRGAEQEEILDWIVLVGGRMGGRRHLVSGLGSDAFVDYVVTT